MASSMTHRRRSRNSHPLNSLNTANLLSAKGATFHSPSSASTSDEEDVASSPNMSPSDGFFPPRFCRAKSSPEDVIAASRRRAAAIISKLDRNLSSLSEMLSPLEDDTAASSSDSDSDAESDENVLPVPASFITMDRASCEVLMRDSPSRETKPKHNNHASDSGLGTSLASSKDRQFSASSGPRPGIAIVGAAAAAAATMDNTGLGDRAVSRIQEHILLPMLAKESLGSFRAILMDVSAGMSDRRITCLRDIEKIFWFSAQDKADSPALYINFLITAIGCIQKAAAYLDDSELVREQDVPYTTDYFADLKERLFQSVAQMASRREQAAEDAPRLSRVSKDGNVIPLSNVSDSGSEAPPCSLKRHLSTGSEEDDDEILRSMARRKKNAPVEELIPKKCPVPGCNKKFKRPCDLTKHEKTHLRPFKCKVESCKYHKLGWPTEKELDRHWNDKHSTNPSMYRCRFEPCPYKSKRESNCKQHMEKAHGWIYVRQKTNGKKSNNGSAYGGNAPHQSLSPVGPPSLAYNGAPTPPHEDMHAQFSPYEYPVYPVDQEYMQVAGHIPLQLDEVDFEMAAAPRQQPFASAYPTATTTAAVPAVSTTAYQDDYAIHETMYSSPPHHLPSPEPMTYSHKDLRAQMPAFDSGRPAMMAPPPHHQSHYSQPHSAPYTPPQNHQASFSPHGEGSAMLYTPTSMQDEELAFHESADGYKPSSDFSLFPVGVKGAPIATTQAELLFGHMAAPAILSYSQGQGQQTQQARQGMYVPEQMQEGMLFGWQQHHQMHMQHQQQRVAQSQGMYYRR